ncbi:MAG TPA: hypothetical protein VFU14_10830 [Acidimicrobiales bacterium]|nr:hypothetical protein [Acidimicrobiales bacterium]
MSRRPGRVDVRLERAADHLVVRWSSDHAEGSCRFDHVPGTAPEWIGAADELLEGADRRLEGRVLAAVGELAEREGLQLGIWHDDAGVEVL